MNSIIIASALVLYASLILWRQNRHGVHSYILSDEHTKQQHRAHDCVDISFEYSMCSADPMVELGHVYSKARLNGFHIGVTQTIDGTEEEKQSIRNVLTQMNRYWKHEVLANFEYDEVRASCKNKNKLCAFWATVGECESNRVFMLSNCALACRFCLLQHTYDGQSV